MKSKFPIITTAFAGAGLLAGAIYAGAQQAAPAVPPPVNPATHAAHVASGAMPPDAAKADPALAQQIAQLQAKVAQPPWQMISMGVAHMKKAEVSQCFLCHQTTSWNDIKGVGFYKHH